MTDVKMSEAGRLASCVEKYGCIDEQNRSAVAAELRRLAAVECELETERIRLAACSVIANANTPESAISARQMAPGYWSSSAADVATAVDREMALRADRDSLSAKVEALRDALCKVLSRSHILDPFTEREARAAIDAAKASAA